MNQERLVTLAKQLSNLPTTERVRRILLLEATTLDKGGMGTAAEACRQAAREWPDESCQRLADLLAAV